MRTSIKIFKSLVLEGIERQAENYAKENNLLIKSANITVNAPKNRYFILCVVYENER